jgi:tyrocidine synthetase-3
MILLAVYFLLLAKLSGQEDIIIGIPALGRMHADLYDIIGIFINTLALRAKPRREITFVRFLDQVKEKTLDAFDNQEYPFETLVKQIAPGKELSRHPIFDVMFDLQNFLHPIRENIETGQPGQRELYAYENPTTKFDLALIAVEEEETLHFVFQYSRKLFKRQTIQRFIGYYQNIVSTITSAVDVNQGKDIELKDIKISHDLFDRELNALEADSGDFEF